MVDTAKTTKKERKSTVRRKTGPKASAEATRKAGDSFVGDAGRKGTPQPIGKPHRYTLDLNVQRYQRLKLLGITTGQPMNEVLYQAFDEFCDRNPDLLSL